MYQKGGIDLSWLVIKLIWELITKVIRAKVKAFDLSHLEIYYLLILNFSSCHQTFSDIIHLTA